jgi:hypothetical protein
MFWTTCNAARHGTLLTASVKIRVKGDTKIVSRFKHLAGPMLPTRRSARRLG